MRRVGLLLVSVLSVFAAVSARAQTPLDSAFTYQGELTSSGTPATGTYDIRFRLYDAADRRNQIGPILCSDNLSVSAGRFAVTLDFGPAAFDGQQRFLEIEVRADAGQDCGDESSFTILTPRQEITAAPNALFAKNAATATTATTALTADNAASLDGLQASFFNNAANLTGTLADARLSTNIARLNSNQTFTGQLTLSNPANTFTGNGAGLTNLSGSSINPGTLTRSSLTADVQSGLGTLVPDLSLAGSVATGNFPRSVTVSGSFAYVVNQASNTLQVFSISNPGAPTLAGSIATGSQPISVEVSGSFAYVVGFPNTLQVFNISNPAAPTLAGSVATGGNPTSVVVSGSFAYVVNQGSSTLQVFNVSNPAAPTLTASVATSQPSSVVVSGSFAYIISSFAFTSTLQVFNISNPAAPALVGSIAIGTIGFEVAVSGSFAYVATGQTAVRIFNISNPAAPTLAGSISTPDFPSGIAVSGSFAYVASLPNTLQVFNISNPAAPTLAASVATAARPSSLAVSGSLAYVTNFDSNTLQVFRTNGVNFGTPLSSSSLTGVNGSGLTGVNAAQLNGQAAAFYTNASNITTGTLDDARLSSNIPLKNAANAFTSTGVTSFAGNMNVTGSLAKGGGSFKIDHPLDPENKYLYHSFVESPDMMNIYNGNIVTDGQGYATITLPDYFEALNRDFRYQLTVIDPVAPDVHFVRVAQRVAGNSFTIKSTPGNLEVSWQVTGIRKDAWAEKNRIPNSIDKPAVEKGTLLHPEAFGKPTKQRILTIPAGVAAPAKK
jgi:hypothetical protein